MTGFGLVTGSTIPVTYYSGGGASLIIFLVDFLLGTLACVLWCLESQALHWPLHFRHVGCSITSDRQITGGGPALSWPKYLLAVSTIAADAFTDFLVI